MTGVTRSLLAATLGMIAICAQGTVVADSDTRKPLHGASVFDSNGRFIGTSTKKGRIACASAIHYPLTISFMGYEPAEAISPLADSIFMRPAVNVLQEVVVSAKERKLLHILAYAREYSTLSTYTDTISLFREKMIDFMLPPAGAKRIKGWKSPRVLNSKSYYLFTNAYGLDSVSDRCNNHFTWADRIGIIPETAIPQSIARAQAASDTIRGKYSPYEIWTKSTDNININVDVLADKQGLKWVPGMSQAFSNPKIDFEQFKIRLSYFGADSLLRPIDLTSYSFNIDSRGRGHNMFKFNKVGQPFFVTTYTEVYILDKEYITPKEASKWEKNLPEEEIEICESPNAPTLQPAIRRLVARVEAIDHTEARLSVTANREFTIIRPVKRNFGQEMFMRLKQMFGIDNIHGKMKRKRQWNDARREQVRKNNERARKREQKKNE